MDKLEKTKYHQELLKYSQKKKMKKLFDRLLQKLMFFQPKDIFSFLIEQIKVSAKDFTFLIFGNENVLNENVMQLLKHENNVVFFNYKDNFQFELLREFNQSEGTKAKFILNFPLNFDSLIMMNQNAFFYDQIFYIKNEEKKENKTFQKIEKCFEKNITIIQKKNYERFLQTKITLINKEIRNPKILVLNQHSKIKIQQRNLERINKSC